MLRITENATSEIEVKKSKFISYAFPVDKLEDVKQKVLEVRKMHPNASHVVHASVVGINGSEFSFSDDKEPKNTAGRPSLEVLKGSGITNITVCIVRYFGGTLLGTGGLVKAYSDAVKEVLKVVKTEELVSKVPFKINLSYENYNQIKRLLVELEINTNEEFLEGINITGLVKEEDKEKLKKEVNEIGQGKILISFS